MRPSRKLLTLELDNVLQKSIGLDMNLLRKKRNLCSDNDPVNTLSSYKFLEETAINQLVAASSLNKRASIQSQGK